MIPVRDQQPMEERSRNSARTMLTLLAGFAFGIHAGVLLHELGHALGVVVGGGQVTRIVMEVPLPAGHVEARGDWQPATVWGGVVFGSLLSLGPLLLARKAPAGTPLRFALLMWAALGFAHNGLYLVAGAGIPFADAANMIRLGAPRPLLAAAGVPVQLLAIGVLARALSMSGLDGGDSPGRWLAVTVPPLLAIPLLMLAGALISPAAEAMRPSIALLVAGYAVTFTTAAWRARKALLKDAGNERAMLPASWRVPLGLAAGTALLVGLELSLRG